MEKSTRAVMVGIDVGSTTTKIAVVRGGSRQVVFSDYRRHHSSQMDSVATVLQMLGERFPGQKMRLAFTGSGAKPLATALGVPYIQEVVANAQALKEKYENVGTAIELGGQDAKIIFFQRDQKTGELQVADMRMNGSCAGGTGAFLDEIAEILKIPVEEMDELASQGSSVYDISGRCGVYAKTDIQPLINQGIAKPDLALSALHAIAKQTIGGLAQGLDIVAPVAFEGGPMTFVPTLVRVFAERLGLKKEEILIPHQPEIMVAYGAALSLETLFAKAEEEDCESLLERVRKVQEERGGAQSEVGTSLFASEEEQAEFSRRHRQPEVSGGQLRVGEKVRAYLGIDSGSTTTKFVLLDPEERILDTFYAPNEGDPLAVVKEALIAVRNRYREAGVQLEILSAGTTGYGERLLHKAFSADCHVVETVAHARATGKYVPDATFILDIGGQDMKAIWLDQGIITNILVNEACSSGCGSFLENFASSLQVPTDKIAEVAFASREPACLGSRCTVFMNSSIVTAQRNGKTTEDILAGLCRSIIENVFTKVIRISNLDSLGDKVVVQGGTFQNDAVLRAMEQYLGREVVRAPYPGIMGAIGAALTAKEHHLQQAGSSTFLDLDELEAFTYEQQANVPCQFCANHCKRVVMTFSNGNSWVTNNRCERGEILGDSRSQQVKEQLRNVESKRRQVPNLFAQREKLLFQDYPVQDKAPDRGITVGIPRVLYFWDSMPFWTTFLRALGFGVVLSKPSSREMYESGLAAVTSDTVCFPAKLVHGHLRDLAKRGVDRIFMPSVTTLPTENREKNSESMCAVVKGYPIVIRNSDDPQSQWGIPFDAPLFHWHTQEDRRRQITQYMRETFALPVEQIRKALQEGDRAQESFRRQLKMAGQAVLDEVERTGKYAVVLASRPYQNDPLVNHHLPEMFTDLGIPVLTADSLPEIESQDLSKSRLDVVNNYHARMLSSAMTAAASDHLEYVQIVSFGCGHDAYLSDEIIRLMREISGKTPLILKVDESDIQGPLQIRVRSFVETVRLRRQRADELEIRELTDPYPVKYTKEDRMDRTILVPNTSHAFSRIMAAAFSTQGTRAVPLEVGRDEAIRLGKKYVHNDICFPAQIVIGEALAALESGEYDPDHVAVGMGKYIGDCRLTHYSALLRKALDDAGYPQVPIMTNDDADDHDLHPGFRMNLHTAATIAFALPMVDVLEELLRKIRPYEEVPGSTEKAFERAMDQVVDGMQTQGIRGLKKGFERAIEIMGELSYDRSRRRPEVLIVGEYLLNFHPGANHDIEAYLEQNGFEVVEARMTDVIRKSYFCRDAQNREFKLDKGISEKSLYYIENRVFDLAHDLTDKIARRHHLYSPACRLPKLVKKSDEIIYHTFDAGEGVLIPGEIIHHAEAGCKNFVILQPFGCLPNHVVGRGIVKKLKERYPDAQILPLDYDPDVSFANIENRLQMLVMNMAGTQSEGTREDVKKAGRKKAVGGKMQPNFHAG